MITHNVVAFHDYWNIDLHIDKIFADNIYILFARDSYRCNSVLLLERDNKLNLKASLKKYLQNDSINWYHAYNRLNNIILTMCIIHNKYIYILYLFIPERFARRLSRITMYYGRRKPEDCSSSDAEKKQKCH